MDRSGTISNGGAAQELMPANPGRVGFLVQNNSAGDLWFNEEGATAVANQPSLRLAPGETYRSEPRQPCPKAVSVFGATTGQAFTAREW